MIPQAINSFANLSNQSVNFAPRFHGKKTSIHHTENESWSHRKRCNLLKPGFHVIVPIIPVVSKNQSGWLRRLLVSIWSSQSLQILKTRGCQQCSWVQQQSFGTIFGNEMADINRRASLLACYLLILSILRCRRAQKIPRHRFWVRQIYQKWEELGVYHTLVQELRLHDREFFFR